uniref:Cytoplasmic tRNA 2-thiolation protein 2 n=1 Tax=Aceria tosichella TaxID=561515 RepID=A0A6G1SMW3_9ACAR
MTPEGDQRVCRKCGRAPFIVLDKVHVECKDCFVESSVKRFRQTVGKPKLIRNNDSLLVAYSGGQSSCALLDLMKSRLDLSSGPEPKFRPSILHIDVQSILCDSSLLNIKSSRLNNLNNLLQDLRQRYPAWPIYWTSIETCMASSSEVGGLYKIFKSTEEIDVAGSHLLTNEDAHVKLQEAISRIGDLTDKQNFVTERCKDLINRVALAINSTIEVSADKLKFVLVGSSATQLANNLLVDVILGHGSTIRPAVSVLDERFAIPLLRPMRDFSKKEIAFYLRARGIESATQPNILTKADRKACIQTVTETFLSKLYVDYPATYSTLLRTGGKLV